MGFEDEQPITLSRGFIRRLQINRVKSNMHIKRPEYIGQYMLLHDINHLKRGDIIDNPEGFIHGVWCPEYHKVIEFSNEYFYTKIK